MRIENSGTATQGQQQNSSRSYPNISMTHGDLEEAKWESSGYAGNHNKPRIATEENGYGFPDVQEPQDGAPDGNSAFHSGFKDKGYHGASQNMYEPPQNRVHAGLEQYDSLLLEHRKFWSPKQSGKK